MDPRYFLGRFEATLICTLTSVYCGREARVTLDSGPTQYRREKGMMKEVGVERLARKRERYSDDRQIDRWQTHR